VKGPGRWDSSEIAQGATWVDAVAQIFFGLSIACGAMPAYASGQGLTLVHFSAQPEPFWTQNAPYSLPDTLLIPRKIPLPPQCTPCPTQSAYVEPRGGRV